MNGNGGNDVLQVYDSAGNDTLTANLSSVVMTGTGYRNAANGFKVSRRCDLWRIDTANVTDTTAMTHLPRACSRLASAVSVTPVAGSGFELTTITSIGGNDTA